MASINLSVARSCFVRCDGCYNNFGDQSDVISTGAILTFLSYARSRGEDHVTLCGGDPLARPDIIDLAQKIQSLGFRINLDTVGTPLLGDATTIFFGRSNVSKVDASTLARIVDLIGIPIDGASNEDIAKFRQGRPQLLDEQLAVLHELGRVDAKVCVNTVVHRQNTHAIVPILAILRKYAAVVKWQLFQYSPTGPLGSRRRSAFAISDLTFREIQDRVQHAVASTEFIADIEFKSNMDRIGLYLLIDANGVAWTPDLEGPQRTVLGNINDPNDFDRILSRENNLACIPTS